MNKSPNFRSCRYVLVSIGAPRGVVLWLVYYRDWPLSSILPESQAGLPGRTLPVTLSTGSVRPKYPRVFGSCG